MMFMRHIANRIMIAFLLLVPMAIYSQPPTPPAAYASGIPVNYVRSWEPVKPELNANAITVSTGNPKDYRMTTEYLDGLGRQLQVVMKKGALNSYNPADNPMFVPVSGDRVAPIVYDGYGRQSMSYLPYAGSSTDGFFKTSPFTDQVSFYNTQLSGQIGETNVGPGNLNWAFGQTNYESSPLNRTVETFSPGNSWVGSSTQPLEQNRHSIKTRYFTNTSTDEVRIWNVAEAGIGNWSSYSSSGIYPDGVLIKKINVNAEAKQTIEFSDKEGRVILRKVQLTAASDNGSGSSHTGWLCTYYIYDDLGRPRCVIQPNGVEEARPSWTLTPQILSENCFRYEFDERDLMIMRKFPGAGELYFVYDQRRRPVMTQDARQRAVGEWVVTKYDGNNRVIETGSWVNGTSFSSHRANGAISEIYPASTASGYTLLTIYHYDDYAGIPGGFDNLVDATLNSYLPAATNTAPDFAQSVEASKQVYGKLTWQQTRVLGTTSFISSAFTYDSKGRLSQQKTRNLTGGYDAQIFQYGWHGEILYVLERTQDGTSGSTQSLISLVKCSYDDLRRLIKVERKTGHTTINGTSLPNSYSTLLTQEYDALGQVKRKTIGSKKTTANVYYNPRQYLQSLEYDYNIQGWVLGMNRNYVSSAGQTSDGKLFGYELGYDKVTNVANSNFAASNYSGSITGVLWKSDGDDIRRKYDYSYDAASRLLQADYNAENGTWDKSLTNFSVKLGDNGADDNTAYDRNGNIKKMNQWGNNLTGPTPIDQLEYFYFNGGNKLKEVRDAVTADYNLGDFQNKNITAIDYGYDVNGNMVTDLNKKMIGTPGLDVSSGGAIHYNYMNLPDEILIADDAGTPKGKISYVYDALGSKLKKTVEEYALPANGNVAIITTTSYLNNAVFESKTVNGVAIYARKFLYAGMEEGRIRAVYSGTSPASMTALEYDYMIKDNLGNVRMVITEQVRTIYYPAATMEGTYSPTGTAQANSMVNYEKQFYKIDDTKIVNETSIASWSPETTGNTKLYYNNNGNPPYNLSYPSGVSPVNTDGSNNLYQTNASTNRTGLELMIKVMAGDKIDIFGKSFHQNSGTINNSNSTPLDLLSLFTSLLTSPGNSIAPKGVSAGDLFSLNSGLVPGMFLTGSNGETTTTPKAYINYIFLDEQFRYAGGWASRVQSAGTVTNHWSVDANLRDITVPKNGYLMVYVSNESNVNVYFDNLQIVHKPGPILEETHYYPFGMTMKAISSKAAAFGEADNRTAYSGQEKQDREFSYGQGLEYYDYGARMYDPQLGRWHVMDPVSEVMYGWSPYQFTFNNPVLFIDKNGKLPIYPYFTSADAAAYYWSMVYASRIKSEDAEYSAAIFKVVVDGKEYYSFTEGHRLKDDDGHSPGPSRDAYNWQDIMPPGAVYVAHIHAHRPTAEPGNQTFSPTDEDTWKRAGSDELHFYLLNMYGQLRVRRGARTYADEKELTDGGVSGFYDATKPPKTWRNFEGNLNVFLRKDNTFTPIPNLGALVSFIQHTKFLDWIDLSRNVPKLKRAF